MMKGSVSHQITSLLHTIGQSHIHKRSSLNNDLVQTWYSHVSWVIACDQISLSQSIFQYRHTSQGETYTMFLHKKEKSWCTTFNEFTRMQKLFWICQRKHLRTFRKFVQTQFCNFSTRVWGLCLWETKK